MSRNDVGLSSLLLALGFLLPSTAIARPTTQACLGAAQKKKTLRCPAGTGLSLSHKPYTVLQCLKRGGARGTIPVRHGPAIWFHKDGVTVKRAGTYLHHTKVGRWYRFDRNGVLEYIEDRRDDWSVHGYRVRCDKQGRLLYLGYFNKNGREQGKSFHFTSRAKFKYANHWHDGRKTKAFDRGAKAPSSAWCRIKRCTFVSKPNTPIPGVTDVTGGFAQDRKVKLTRPPKRSHIGRVKPRP